MLNLEPSWETLGQLVAEAIVEATNIEPARKAALIQMVNQMASIAHHTRAHQLRQKYADGEIDSLPLWVEETLAGA
jgi:hypothetical protein